MNAERFFTVSIDDGAMTDFRAADLLDKFGLDGTFYIPATNPERPVLPADKIRELAARFEVGAHTMSHCTLTGLPRKQAWEEISASKSWLEDTSGKPVTSFCYPRGKFDANVAGLVKKAGFSGARTCFFNLHDFPRDPYLWGVSTHAFSHSRTIQLRHAALERNFSGLVNFMTVYGATRDWHKHFLLGLDHVEKHGGIAHLYLHSWEVDETGQWAQLESALSEMATRASFKKVTNGALFELWRVRNDDRRN